MSHNIAVLELVDVACAIPGRTLFSGLSLSLSAGQSLAVTGPSGVGKSTLLAAIMAMTAPVSGSIAVAGKDVHHLTARQQAAMRREHLGIVFQDGELIHELTAAENVAIALMLADDGRDPMQVARAELEYLAVPPDTTAAHLSGGERQRTAVARALAAVPSLVLADEPTGSLDTVTRDVVADQLFERCAQQNVALLVVTHDPTIAQRADSTLALDGFAPALA